MHSGHFFFSIITVTLDNLQGLKRTYASLNNQSCRDFEWIVIDGGSGDGTVSYLENNRPDQFISEKDDGLYDAMNKGIECAGGNYILFLNAGDILSGNDILRLIKEAAGRQQTPPAFIYGDGIEQGHVRQARSHHKRLRGMFTFHQAMLFERSAIGDMRFKMDYKIAADYDFVLRFLDGLPEERVIYIPQPVCVFESGGLSQRRAGQGRMEQFRIRKDLKACGPLRNIVIVSGQFILWQVRRFSPGLYRLLRR